MLRLEVTFSSTWGSNFEFALKDGGQILNAEFEIKESAGAQQLCVSRCPGGAALTRREEVVRQLLVAVAVDEEVDPGGVHFPQSVEDLGGALQAVRVAGLVLELGGQVDSSGALQAVSVAGLGV